MTPIEQQAQILIVDDTAENVDVLAGILREHYKIKVALNGPKALKIAQSEPAPDLILLDIMMPEMDGCEVCRRLKQDPNTADIPVIFVTAKNEVEDETKGFDLGAVDYITKPINPHIVLSRVRAHLALSQATRALKRRNQELEEKVANDFFDVTADTLKALILCGESGTLEFKSTLRHNLHSGKNDKAMENAVLKSIAGFLNSQGGHLMVGVDDAGIILGLKKDGFANQDRALLHLNALICEHLGSQVAPYVRSSLLEVDGNEVLSVQCISAPMPIFMNRAGTEAFYVRMGPASRQLSPSELLSHVQSQTNN
jgi:putative two-component system response regulator